MDRRYKPTKKEIALAQELRSQIGHLTCRWHLDFTEAERDVIRKALFNLQEQYVPAVSNGER